MTKFELAAAGKSYTVDVSHDGDSFVVVVNGEPFKLRLKPSDDPQGLVAEFSEKPLHVTVSEANSQRVELTVSGEQLAYQKPTPVLRTQSSLTPSVLEESDVLTAPMPGRVISLMAKKGDAIKKGDAVVVIESMKMEVAVRSDRDAVVQRIMVAEGASVKRGEPLVKFSG